MGRAERRKAERRERIENRKDKILISKDHLSKSRKNLIDEANKYSTECLMTCFAITMHRLYGFGPKRIFRALEYIDGMMGEIIADRKTMDDYIKELEDETGVLIKTDD